MRSTALLLVSLASSLACAQVGQATPDLRDLQSSRNMAMGGAYEALGYGAEAIGGNPAAMSLFKKYRIEASGSFDIPQAYGFGTLGILDATHDVSAGLTYHFATFGGEERRWAHLTTLALGYAFGDLIHIGLAARHQVLVGASKANSVTVNAGVLAKPTPWLTLGFSGHNLIHVYNRDISRYFVASAGARILEQVTPAIDVRMDFNQPEPRLAFHGGVEWLIAQIVPVRLGYQFDGIENHQYLSAGVGWYSDGSGVDFAYRHELGGQEGRLLSLTLKLQLQL